MPEHNQTSKNIDLLIDLYRCCIFCLTYLLLCSIIIIFYSNYNNNSCLSTWILLSYWDRKQVIYSWCPYYTQRVKQKRITVRLLVILIHIFICVYSGQLSQTSAVTLFHQHKLTSIIQVMRMTVSRWSMKFLLFKGSLITIS